MDRKPLDVSHPHEAVAQLETSFSDRLLHPRCIKKCYCTSLFPAALRLCNHCASQQIYILYCFSNFKELFALLCKQTSSFYASKLTYLATYNYFYTFLTLYLEQYCLCYNFVITVQFLILIFKISISKQIHVPHLH